MAPLPVPTEVPRRYAELASVESLTLLVDRIGRVRPDLELRDTDAVALARICRALDGLPLAIELAAGRLRSLTVVDLADRLDDQLAVLTRHRTTAGDDDRHRSLRVTLDWSYDLLADEQRRLARRLSVFAGGFRLDAVDAVCPDGVHVLDGIDELVAKSLVTFDARTARYRMLEPIRQHLRQRLDASGETTATGDAHARWTAALCDRLGSRLLDDQRANSIRLREETGNIDAALRWALHRGDDETALRMVGSLGWFWFIYDQATGRRAAMQHLRHAVAVYRELDDPWQLASALLHLATQASADEGSEGLQALAESTVLHARIGPRQDRAIRLAAAAIVHFTRGDMALASAALGAWDTHRRDAVPDSTIVEVVEHIRAHVDPADVAAAAERARHLPIDGLLDELILRPAGLGG